MKDISRLQPKEVFYWFEKISSIPRKSKNEKGISDFIKKFCSERDIQCIQDHYYNIVMVKEATLGYENSEAIILQGHMDMVCAKTKNSKHNFNVDPLDLYVDGDYIKAKDTTLGGDNGIAVAMILALFDQDYYCHPKIEAIITSDEEEGMVGAEVIDISEIEGKKFINLDSEEEGILYVSSAGGITVRSLIPISKSKTEGIRVEIEVIGLVGGHSGTDIDKERGNANKIVGRVLHEIKKSLSIKLISLEGGNADNAITKEAKAEVIVESSRIKDLVNITEALNKTLKKEYKNSDKNIEVKLSIGEEVELEALGEVDTGRIITFLNLSIHGVQYMSTDIKGLVETSTNLGIMKLDKNKFEAVSLVRGSCETRYKYVSSLIETLTLSLGGTVDFEGEYPAWEYEAESELIDIMKNVYEEMFGEKPEVMAIHAGLECSLFSKKVVGFDCVSMGPEMHGVHTTEEKLSITSVERTWNYLIKLLETCK